MELLAKLMMEFLGTAILVFTIQVSVSLGDQAPLAIGGILISLIFAGGPVSGAHYNPAVSLSITLRKAMESSDMIPYWLSQIFGSICGAIVGRFVVSNSFVISIGDDSTLIQALCAELIFTFVLCFVILCCATSPDVMNNHYDNHYFGVAIGVVVVVGAIMFGPISGAAFNPAVAIGLSLAGGFSNIGYGLLVSICNLIGAVISVLCFFVIYPMHPSKSEDKDLGLSLKGGTISEVTPLKTST